LEEGGGDSSQLPYYLKKFGLKSPPAIPQNNGQLVVFYEQGLVPSLHSASFPFNIQDASQIFTFPIYTNSSATIPTLAISEQLNNKLSSLGQTQQLVNVQALAAKTLIDDYPIIFIREALRLTTQVAVLTSATDNANNSLSNDLANAFATSLYMTLMAGADLRSWLTLPHTVQAYQTYLPAAQISLILDQDGLKQVVPLTLKANKTTLVWVVNAHNNLQVKVINL